MMIDRIVVGIDGSAGSRAALEWVADLAVQLGAHVTVVHVFEPLAKLGEIDPPYDMHKLAEQAREQLDGEWVMPLALAGVPHETVFAEGAPGERLAHMADEVDADLIVVGDRGHAGLRKMLFGSTARELPRQTTRPVTVIHSDDD